MSSDEQVRAPYELRILERLPNVLSIVGHDYEERRAIVQDATEIITELVEALRPFASHIGKDGELVKLAIGNDTWTGTLSTEDFTRARRVLRRTRAGAKQ